jgi:hypothetical protein
MDREANASIQAEINKKRLINSRISPLTTARTRNGVDKETR